MNDNSGGDGFISSCGPAFSSLKIQRINVDEDSAMVDKYNITSVPTYILLKEGGEIVSFVVGAKAKAGFIKLLGLNDKLKFGENSTDAS